MARRAPKAPHVADLLRRHRDDISAGWAEMIHNLPGTRYGEYPLGEVRAWTSRGVTAAIEAFASGSYQPTETYLLEMALTRLEMGFGIAEVIQGLWHFKEAVLPILHRELPPASPEVREAQAALDTYLRFMIGRFGHLYAEAMTWDLVKQQKRTALILEAVRKVNSSLELDQVLQWIVDQSAAIFRLACTLCLLDAEQQVLIPKARAGHPDDAQRGAFRPISQCPAPDPLICELLEEKKPIVCCEPSTDPRFSQEMIETLGLRSTLVAPITADGRVLGALVCTTPDDDCDFADEDIELVVGLVNAVGLAVQNAQLFEQTRRRLAEMESLQRVTTALLRNLTLDETLGIVCFEAQKLTNAAGSTLLLVEDGTWLRAARTTGTPSPTSDRLPLAGSFAELAMGKGKPLLVDDPGRLSQAYHSVRDLETLLVIPLARGEVIIGALEVVNVPGEFRPEDLQIMSLFADGAAIAIETARLHEQAEQLAVLEERQRLAHELHDSVTQALYSVTLYAEATRMALSAGKQEVAVENLQQLQNMAREAMIDMRLLIFELRPPVLEEEGLVAALQTRLASVETRAGLQTEIRVQGVRRLPIWMEEELYRIALESFNNVIRHASAQRVTVDLVFDDHNVCLRIADDGQGFDRERAEQGGGMGLPGIRERVRRIGGTLNITSAPGLGTTVAVKAGI